MQGEITFDAQGKRVTNIIGIHQYRNQGNIIVAIKKPEFPWVLLSLFA